MDQDRLGKFIKQLREEKNISQEKLANKLYVDRSLISKWETSKLSPDIKYLRKICEIFDVDLKELIYGERVTKENFDRMNNYFYTYFSNKDKKYKSIKKAFFGIIIFMLIILTLFLVYYFRQTYSTTKIYRISGESDNYKIEDGLLIITRENTYLKLGNIVNYNDDIKLYYNANKDSNLIYEGNSNSILVDFAGYNSLIKLKSFDSNKNKLLLVIDNDEIVLSIEELYSNDNLIFENKKKIIKDDNKTTNNIPETIINDFKCDNDECILIINNIKIRYVIAFNILYIDEDKMHIEYNFNSKIFSYNDNNDNVFTVSNETIECITDKCNNEKELFDKYYKIISKYIN